MLYKTSSLRRTVSVCLLLSIAFFVFSVYADPLDAGVPVLRSSMSEGRFINYSQGQRAEGETVALNWHLFRPGTETDPEMLKSEQIYYVARGSVRALIKGEFVTLKEGDLLRLEAGTKAIIEAGPGSSAVVEFTWPSGPGGEKALFPADRPINRSYLQYLMPDDSRLVKMVQAPGGRILFTRLLPTAVKDFGEAKNERILYVERGFMSATIGGKSISLGDGVFLRIAEGTDYCFEAGEHGCDYIEITGVPILKDLEPLMFERVKSFHSIMPKFAEPELVVDGRYGDPLIGFSEGPNWYHGKFYFVDQGHDAIYTLDMDNRLEKINDDFQPSGTAILPNGNLAVCNLTAHSIVEMRPDGSIARTLTDKVDGAGYTGILNDIVADADGGLYFTNMAFNDRPKCNILYYRSPGGKVRQVTEIGDFGIPNGCIFSPDQKVLYVNDDKSQHIWALDVESDGSLTNRRPFAELILHESVIGNERTKSFADGMTVDAAGNLYVCASGFVQIFDKEGVYRGGITLPKQAFHCAFGGPDGSWLFICCQKQVYRIKTLTKGVGF